MSLVPVWPEEGVSSAPSGRPVKRAICEKVALVSRTD